MENILELSERQVVSVRAQEQIDLTQEWSKSGFWLMVGASAVFGAWGMACVVCGLLSCDSIAALRDAIVTALLG